MKKSNNNMTLLIEVVSCAVLIILLSWSSTVSIAAEMCAAYLRELSVFRFSTHSVFLVGNLIIIVVVVQSTKSSEKTTPAQKVQFAPHHVNIADQKIKSTDPLYSIVDQNMKYDPRYYLADEKIKSHPPTQSTLNAGDFPDTQITNNIGSVSEQVIVPTEMPDKVSMKKPESSQLYRRTMSAKAKKTFSKPELMRSKTVKWGTGEKVVAGRFDEMNHEEFRLKIESFIEKQRRLIREELIVAGSDEHGFSLRR